MRNGQAAQAPDLVIAPADSVNGSNADYTLDGVNDEVQINEAIAAAAANGGGTVEIKAGTVRISSFIKALPYVRVRGQGEYGTRILASGFPTPTMLTGEWWRYGVFHYDGGVKGFEVSDLSIDASAAALRNLFGFSFVPLPGETMSGLSVRRVKMKKGAGFARVGRIDDGTIKGTVSDIVFEDCLSEYCDVIDRASGAFDVVGTTVGQFKLINNRIIQPAKINAAVNECGIVLRETVLDAEVRGNYVEGPSLGMGFPGCRDLKLVDNVLVGIAGRSTSTGYDISVQRGFSGLKKTLIKGNTVRGPSWTGGIFLGGDTTLGGQDMQVLGNQCYDIIGGRGIYIQGISAAEENRYLEVADNMCVGNGITGIQVTWARYADIHHNHCLNNSQSTPGRGGIELYAVRYSHIHHNRCFDDRPLAARTQAYGIREANHPTTADPSNYNVIEENDLDPNLTASLTFVGANTRIRRNRGYATETQGSGATARITAAVTAVDVTHGLAVTPLDEEIEVHPITTLGLSSYWWVDNIGAATFRINVDIAPGGNVDFAWKARIERQ